jgi:hypothetical protein
VRGSRWADAVSVCGVLGLVVGVGVHSEAWIAGSAWVTFTPAVRGELEGRDVAKCSALDRLVREITAFRTWGHMLEAMRAGYVPTLNGGVAAAKLCGVVRRNGFKAYRKGLCV